MVISESDIKHWLELKTAWFEHHEADTRDTRGAWVRVGGWIMHAGDQYSMVVTIAISCCLLTLSTWQLLSPCPASFKPSYI